MGQFVTDHVVYKRFWKTRLRLMLRGNGRRIVVAGASEAGLAPLERANKRDSRRRRSFSLESSGSSGYDGGLKFDRWDMLV